MSNTKINNKPFPKLMMSKVTKLVVEFDKSGSGKVITPDGYNKVGEYSNVWNMSVFQDILTKETISEAFATEAIAEDLEEKKRLTMHKEEMCSLVVDSITLASDKNNFLSDIELHVYIETTIKEKYPASYEFIQDIGLDNVINTAIQHHIKV